MTTLDTLEKLADAAVGSYKRFKNRGRIEGDMVTLREFSEAANPATVKALVALCRLQHEALKEYTNVVTSNYDPTSWATTAKDDGHHARAAIAAYERFNGGTE